MKNFFQKTKRKFFQRSAKAGFSFIEVIVSVFLLSFGLIVVIQLMSGNLEQTLDSRNQVIAVELAQEGIELVRNVRDSNWMSGAADSFANFPSGSESDCRIDYKYTSGSSLPCDGDFNLTKSNGFYISTVSSSAVFKRKITISYDTGSSSTANSMTVTSIVTWGGLNFPSTTNCTTATKCAYAQTTLTRWGGK